MGFNLWDWLAVAVYLGVALVLGLRAAKCASTGTESYFAAGRKASWWLAGTSMAASAFSSDTPLAVTGLTVASGLAGNWLWLGLVMGTMCTVYFYARLWRRAGVLTDVEFVELRYAGKPAAVLRGFRALYLGLLINTIIMGWMILGVGKIITATVGWPRHLATGICLLVALTYAALSGLLGVMTVNVFQFAVAMGACILLAIYASSAVGGIEGLKSQLAAQYGAGHQMLSFLPDFSLPSLSVATFVVFVAVQWWACWLPGSEPGGGGYIAQRMFSAKDERHSLLATLWFNVASFALRPWPWIFVALVSAVMFPGLKDAEIGYAKMVGAVLPIGLRGILVAAFFAAFMSAFSALLNLSTSYIINDFYRRFLRPRESGSHYVFASRLVTILVSMLAVVAALSMETIVGAWKFLLAIGAGTGLVYMLRWYWWRCNAWSEIAAMIAALFSALWVYQSEVMDYGKGVLLTTAVTTLVWLGVTWLTAPVPEDHLVRFYRRVRPAGPGWRPVAQKAPEVQSEDSLIRNLVRWALGSTLMLFTVIATGQFLFRFYSEAAISFTIALVSGVLLYADHARHGWGLVSGGTAEPAVQTAGKPPEVG